MGFKSPGQSTHSTNHPRWRRRAQVRLAATAERWGGFGTCVQEWTTGGQRTQLYLTYLALRLSARPDSARRAGATTRLGTGDPEPAKQATTPRAALPPRDPRRGLCLAQGPQAHQGTVLPHDSDRPPPGGPGFQSDAAVARRHGSRNREANVQECVDTHGASSTTRTTRRGHHHSQNCPIDAQGLSIRAGDYHPSSAASG